MIRGYEWDEDWDIEPKPIWPTRRPKRTRKTEIGTIEPLSPDWDEDWDTEDTDWDKEW